MQVETIEKFGIEQEVAEEMAAIYNDYMTGDVSLADCKQALLSSMAMLDLAPGLDDVLNREAGNETYYLARGIVRLPFDSGREYLPGNSLSEDQQSRLACAEFMR